MLGFTKQGFYAWHKRGLSHRDWENAHLIAQICQIQGEDPELGAERVWEELTLDRGVKVGLNRVERLMRQNQTSYWWQFQNLLDVAKGDAAGSHFTKRQKLIREQFDRLEANWSHAANNLRDTWRHSDDAQREQLANEMQALTTRAVSEVEVEIGAIFSDYAPGANNRSVDPRWA